jgi:hypothetical protein
MIGIQPLIAETVLNPLPQAHVNPQHIIDYLSCLFGPHTWQPDEFLLVRGVGEKGTKQEGVFSEDQALQPALYDTAAPIAGSAARYSQHQIGTFIVPAILNAPKAKEENVKLLPALILDLDEVPGWEAIRWLSEEFAAPSMVIASGGRNQHGPKLHAYYVLDTPLPAPEVIPLAVRLAELSGGDPIFMRRTQPIRVPGSVHMKGGEAKPVTLESWNTDTFTAEELTEKMATLGASPWALQKPLTRQGAGVTFSSATSADSNALLTTTVREGGIDGISRFDAFSRVAGHYLHVCRTGTMESEEAFLAVTGWAEAHLVPSWPAERIAREFAALYNREISARGPFPESKKYEPIIPAGAGPEAFPISRAGLSAGVSVALDFVEGLLTEGGASAVYGPSNCGKSFWVVDLAASVATGRKFRGKLETDRGAVVYVALEGSHGTRNRIEALMREGLLGTEDPLFLCFAPVSLLDPSHPARLAESVKQSAAESSLPCRLVILDTLSRAIAGGDENAAKDMTAAVASIDAIRAATGAHVCVVHHTGKDTTRGARGHSALRAALDSEIEASRAAGQDVSVMTVTKQRDLQIGEPMPFRLKVIELATDRRGNAITSCVVDHLSDAPKATAGRPQKFDDNDLLRLLPAAAGDWRKRAEEEYGMKSSTFYDRKKLLIERAAVIEGTGHVWRLNPVGRGTGQASKTPSEFPEMPPDGLPEEQPQNTPMPEQFSLPFQKSESPRSHCN